MYKSSSSEACAEPCQTSEMELFPKIIDSYEPLTKNIPSFNLRTSCYSSCMTCNN